jgi:hypothetical protein
MEWIVKIEGIVDDKPAVLANQRVMVRFDPINESVLFIGQFKPHNKEWVDFCEESYTMEIDLEVMQELLLKVVIKMRERLTAYNNLAEGFTLLKVIEVSQE